MIFRNTSSFFSLSLTLKNKIEEKIVCRKAARTPTSSHISLHLSVEIAEIYITRIFFSHVKSFVTRSENHDKRENIL